MAFRKKKRGGSRKAKSIPLAIAVPIGVMGITQIVKPGMAGDWNTVTKNVTGYDMAGQKFYPRELIQSYAPIAAGWVVHKVAARTGINNYVRRATMGYLSL